MRSLLDFLLRIHFLLLFVLIEALSLILLVNNNNFQQASLVNFSRQISGKYYTRTANLKQYFSLAEQNRKLAEENTRLISILESKYKIENPVVQVIYDTIHNRQYTFTTAQIINNSINNRHNYLTLNKGFAQGIKPEMAVVSQDGVVGIVKGVSKNYSTVISMLNFDYKVSAKIKKNQYFGSLSWDGLNYRYVILNEIPLHADIQLGDTIVTSGFSSIYPEGLMIGTISDFEEKAGSFYQITVLLSVDFKKLYHVYTIENLLRDERLLIEEKIEQ